MLLELALLASALSIDGFALCAGWALANAGSRRIWLLPICFSIAQPLTVGIGWLIGDELQLLIGPAFRYAAAAVLAAVALRMGAEGLRKPEEDDAPNEAPTDTEATLFTLMVLAFASNIDAIFASISTPHFASQFMLSISIIAGAAILFSTLGALIGRKLGDVIGSRAGLLGCVVLLFLSVKIAFGW